MSVTGAFFGSGNDIDVTVLPPDLRSSIEQWVRVAERGDAPAYLPRVRGGRLWWYGAAPDERVRREMIEYLDAWIGPTYSDLASQRGRLDLTDDFDLRLDRSARGQWLRFEVLPRSGPGSGDVKLAVRGALRRLSMLYDERPPSEFAGLRAPAAVLDDLGHALAAADGDLADSLLTELAASGDLDASNIAYLRLRVLASLSRWADVLSDEALEDVLCMRRPAGVSRAVQRAVYEVHLTGLDAAEQDQALLDEIDALLPRYGLLVASAPPAASRAEVVLQFASALVRNAESRSGALERLLGRADTIAPGLGRLLERMRDHLRTPEVPVVIREPLEEASTRYAQGDAVGALDAALRSQASVPAARLACLAAADVGTVEAARAALSALTPEAREAIRSSGAVGSHLLGVLDSLTAEGAPVSWDDWLTRLESSVDRADAVGWAHEHGEQWPALPQERMNDLLARASDEQLEVLGEVAGLFLAAHVDALTGETRALVAERLLAALATGGRTSPAVRVQVLQLTDVLLEAEASAELVVSALEWLGVLREAMASLATIDWQVDLLQSLSYHPVPAPAAPQRQEFVFGTLNDLRRHRLGLDRLSLVAIAAACESLGLELPDDIGHLAVDAGAETDGGLACMAGQRVLIYSLMESAARRAAETLRRLVPTVDVVTRADHVGSDPLREACAGSDVIVVVTAAAKHAATEFISSVRSGAPLVYVNSKGASAILRELAATCR
jgi:hypothetical protein